MTETRTAPPPARPEDEAARQAALERYAIMHTPFEQVYADLVAIAAQICGTPIAAVTLIGEDEQWFKAQTGLGVDGTSRDDAFCAHAILEPNETMVVEDARQDPRFADNPFVTGDPNIRFYAGAPLVTKDGHGLGSLCVIDTVPRTLTSEQTASLQALSRLVIQQIELREQVGSLALAFSDHQVAVEQERDDEERFRLAFEHTASGMLLTSTDGVIQQVNTRLRDMLARSEEELLGHHYHEFTDPASFEQEQERGRRLLAGEATSQGRELRCLRPDGSSVWVNVTTALVRDAGRSPRSFVSQLEDITERRLAEQALRQTRSVGDALVSADSEGRVTAWNPAADALFGYKADEVLGETLTSLIVPERYRGGHAAGFRRARSSAKAPLGGQAIEIEALRKDGSEVWVEFSVGRSGHDDDASFTAVIRDVTQRRAAEEVLRREARTLELLQVVASQANAASTFEEAALTALKAICRHTQWTSGHILTRTGAGIVSKLWWSPEDGPGAELHRVIARREYPSELGSGPVFGTGQPVWTGDLPGWEDDLPTWARSYVRTAAGFPVVVGEEVVAVVELFADRELPRDEAVLEAMSQVTTQLARVVERNRAELRLAHQLLHDPATGLPTRSILLDRVQQALASSARHAASVAVLVIGIERLQLVNESLGYGAGDELIEHVARRLASVIRSEDTLARPVSDEFVVVTQDIPGAPQADEHAGRILEAFREPFTLEAGEAFVQASVGIAVGWGTANAERLLADASASMHESRLRVSGGYAVNDERPTRGAAARQVDDTELHRALERGEMVLYYQPTVVLEDGSIEGVEALLRWQHPQRGLVPPGQFIDLIEENGLIVPIGAWVIEEACAQLARWQRDPDLVPIGMKVNLSARQLDHPGLVETVRSALAKTGVPAAHLVLEVTESVAMRNEEATLGTLDELRALGLKLAIDDFGIGYSSLGSLHRLPVDLLKIDREFVMSIDERGSSPIADAVIDLGHALELTVLAEGIETETQAAYLRARGCDLGQGFLYARPRPADEVEQLLRVPAVSVSR